MSDGSSQPSETIANRHKGKKKAGTKGNKGRITVLGAGGAEVPVPEPAHSYSSSCSILLTRGSIYKEIYIYIYLRRARAL